MIQTLQGKEEETFQTSAAGSDTNRQTSCTTETVRQYVILF